MVNGSRVSVGTSATALHSTSTSGLRVTLNATGAVDLGDPTVTSGAGYELASGTVLTLELDPGDVLHAVAGTTTDVGVLVA